VELLRAAGLTVPETTMLLYELRQAGFDLPLDALSVEECAQTLRDFLTKARSEEHTSELQSRFDLVCRLLLEKKKHRVFYLSSSPSPSVTTTAALPLSDVAYF